VEVKIYSYSQRALIVAIFLCSLFFCLLSAASSNDKADGNAAFEA
jgi:hypothetical protein